MIYEQSELPLSRKRKVGKDQKTKHKKVPYILKLPTLLLALRLMLLFLLFFSTSMIALQ